MSSGSPDSAPSGRVRCPGRTAAGYRPGRSRGSRRHSPALRRAPPGGCCCRSRGSGPHAVLEVEHGLHMRHDRRACGAVDAGGVGESRLLPLLDGPAPGQVAVEGSWALVWSVTTSGRTPRRTSSGKTSAALPSRPTDRARLAFRRPVDRAKGVVERPRRLDVEVAGLQPASRCAALAFYGQHAGAGHGRGQAAARRPCRPEPPVRIHLPVRSPPKCCRPTSTKVS
jgi:hypothetical protein